MTTTTLKPFCFHVFAVPVQRCRCSGFGHIDLTEPEPYFRMGTQTQPTVTHTKHKHYGHCLNVEWRPKRPHSAFSPLLHPIRDDNQIIGQIERKKDIMDFGLIWKLIFCGEPEGEPKPWIERWMCLRGMQTRRCWKWMGGGRGVGGSSQEQQWPRIIVHA